MVSGSIDASSASLGPSAVAAEPAQAERIEVLRGAALSALPGPPGAGGVVNVIDGRIPDSLPEDGLDGAFRVGASSVDAGREVAGSLDKAIGNFVVHLDGTFKETDDYDIPGFAESGLFRSLEEEEHHDEDHEDEGHEDEEHDHDHDEEEAEAFGTLDNSFTKSQSLTGGLSYIGDRGYFGVALHRFESDYGIPGGHSHGHAEGMKKKVMMKRITTTMTMTIMTSTITMRMITRKAKRWSASRLSKPVLM